MCSSLETFKYSYYECVRWTGLKSFPISGKPECGLQFVMFSCEKSNNRRMLVFNLLIQPVTI